MGSDSNMGRRGGREPEEDQGANLDVALHPHATSARMYLSYVDMTVLYRDL